MLQSNRDADFWWLRYFGGIVLPACLSLGGIVSIILQRSYAVWAVRFSLKFVPVTGEQAVLWGIAFLGVALALFANCYMQYHDKMGFHYEWPLAAGIIAAAGAIIWYGWSVMAH
jgi:hypothetical protein